ncbi:unnamed protein product [Adineta steineri]|uniref:DUF5722 domain-containing protein n=1 Tax=Adineta steineri TaxID=433720 RepID=A0A815AJP1_9BILA|nr:unnamed protein product [Adineta steineri]CAF1257650.1 unnamed protein product [Adineta steineri]CAF1436874.1 unnamed protein product [Adineta steineri]CAF1546231.1 unnamed protein product [Adineta steineri]
MKKTFDLLLWIIYWKIFIVYALSDQKFYRPSIDELNDPSIYPQRSVYGIKAIQPDDWKIEDFTGNGVGGVVINLVWAAYQPEEKRAPCSSNEVDYDGYCFIPADEAAIKLYTSQQFMVTGILLVPPFWARKSNTNCRQANQNFCAPDNPIAFGRFAGFIAWYFNGQNNHGRITEFVIMNEVNAAEWYNVGCRDGVACEIDKWVTNYAQVYTSAYDAIRHEQVQAPVLISFEHHFDSSLDKYINNSSPIISAHTFLRKLVPQLDNRQWALAYHPYPPNLLRAEFSRNDWPKITFGNINRLVGWLMQNYPNNPSAHKIYLTENGINSLSPNSDQNKQYDQLCVAFEIILSTPNIDLFIYHRMKDHPVETKDGLGLGLVDTSGQYKRAWSLWALTNRFDITTNKLSCGFENLPYVILKRGKHPISGHFSTTRPLPSGYKIERTWKLFREYQPNTKLIFECARTNDKRNFPSVQQNCENQDAWGPLGYIYIDQTTNPNAIPIYRCRSGSNYFISPDSKCENTINEGLLGYALT